MPYFTGITPVTNQALWGKFSTLSATLSRIKFLLIGIKLAMLQLHEESPAEMEQLMDWRKNNSPGKSYWKSPGWINHTAAYCS